MDNAAAFGELVVIVVGIVAVYVFYKLCRSGRTKPDAAE
jgi:uncharacterized membrane protein YuzA (DUF378 family)